MNSFITEQPGKVLDATRTTNNYESVDYDPQTFNPRFKFNPSAQYSFRPNKPVASYDSNTADIYSYRELNEVYHESEYMKPEIRSPITTLNHQKSSNYIEVKPLNVLETEKNNIYTASSSVYSIKYLIDINDLKTHLASTNTLDTLKTKNSESNLVKEKKSEDEEEDDEKVVNNYNKNVTKNKIHIHSNSCCCFKCCGLFNFCFQIFQFLCSLCLKPCCSTAGVLSGLCALGSMLTGAALLGIVGVIPIPYEITKNICNSTNEKNFYYYQHNHTFFVEKNNSLNPNFYFNRTCPDVVYRPNWTTVDSRLEEKKLDEKKRMFALELKSNLSRKMDKYKKIKNKISKLIPLSYDITLRPRININEFSFDLKSKSPNLLLEMKMSLIIKLLCNHSTNLILINTREFSNIDLSLEKTDELEIKKWNHDSSTNILEIELNRNCFPQSIINLNMFIAYKNYGSFISNKNLENSRIYFMTNFYPKFDYAFPIIVESYVQSNDEYHKNYIVFTGSSSFNLTLEKPVSSPQLIFNTDIEKREEKDGYEYLTYKKSPYFPIQTIGFIFGDLKCKESYDLEKFNLKLKICSTDLKDLNIDIIDMISHNVKLLIQFYSNYTKRNYPLEKIDFIILPYGEHELAQINQVGILYLPVSFINSKYYSNDQLTKLRHKLNLANTISKQLVKHWFYESVDIHCDNEQDIYMDTLNLMNLCVNNSCQENDTNLFLQQNLDLNEKCFLFKGVINWISYLGFQSVHPDLFDLVHLEWSLIKNIDETYFLTNKNLNHVYQYYEFPRLVDGDNFQKIKSEIKSLISARALYLMFGKERFQAIIKEWFKMTNEFTNKNSIGTDYQDKAIELKRLGKSLLKIFEQFFVQYNLISLENVTVKSILKSWILSENDIIFSVERNYNKKEALVKIEHKLNSNSSLINYYYPFNWFQGTVKSISSFDLTETDSYNNLNQINNLIWINETSSLLKHIPGADKWLVGNYMKMFDFLRVNYDLQNWAMITQQLIFDFKSFNVNERVQIIDDVFYLINNQHLSIRTGLNMLEYLKRETRYLPWKFAVDHIKKIFSYIEDDSQIYSKFREFIIGLVKPVYERLQWGENLMDSTDEKLIRILVVDLMCSLDYEDCVDNSVKQLMDIIKINVNNIPQYLSKSVYCTAIRHTGINEWFYLWKLFLAQSQNDNLVLKDSYLYSLSCSSQNWILNLYLRKLVYENSILFNDLPIIVGYISKNPVGKYVTWNHISQNYQNFYNKIGNDPELFVKILQVATSEFKFKYEIKQIYDFTEEIGLRNYSIYYDNSNEIFNNKKDNLFSNIENRMSLFTKWKHSNAKDLDDWLNKKQLRNL
ncbi:unnamed protein product [Brachionus calyciflorus]|uniref:ERAP1-like C-terminal domain-containing protein n=1 Tax=Brachionus calyciflorus TaxID=104777 RepID=A0A813M8B7_9BILA|nr:unnamed protein product [Brachionus calyciflorus]